MRIGGSALGNGVVFYTVERWSAAVRDDSGVIRAAQGKMPFTNAGGGALHRLLRLGSSVVLLAAVKLKLPQARPPFGLRSLTGAVGVAALAGRVAFHPRLKLSPLQREVLSAVSAMLPALALPGRGDALRYHGAEHMTVTAIEQGGREQKLSVDTVRPYSRVHPRCGSSLAWYLLFTTIVTNLLVRRLTPGPGRLASAASGLISVGVALELFNRAQNGSGGVLAEVAAGLGAFTQKNITTAEPTDPELEVAIRAMQGLLSDVRSSGA